MKSSDAIALENIEDDCMDNAYWEIVSITGDFRLRLNGEIVGIGAKIYPTDLLEIEALSASTMSGSDQITFDIYEGSESGAEPLRTITRRFTAAAAEIMADYNGDGVRTSYDHWRKSLNSGGRWVVARCTEPYRLWIRNESPLDSDVVVTMSGETNRPSLKSGNRILLPGYSATNSAPFAMRNSSAVLLLDASGTNSTAVLSSSIQAPGGGVLDSEALTIEVVDVNLGERWIAAGETAHYSFGDWASNSYWEIMTASGGLTVDMGYGNTFSTSTSLPAGNYFVMAHFDVNAIAGATCSTGGELHVVDTVIEKESYGVQCSSDSRVLVALDMDLSSGPANWRIEPYIQGGARLYSTQTGGTGSETLAYLSEVWVSAGSIPRDYTITATHPFVAEASDTSDFQVASLDLDFTTWFTRAGESGSREASCDIANMDVSDLRWSISPEVVGGTLISGTAAGPGQTELDAMRTVHILAGGPATNYTLRAWHTDYPDICSTATVPTVLIELMPEHSAFRADDATRMLFSAEIANMDISDLSWSVLPSVNGGARLHTSSSSAGGGATSVTGISKIWLLPGDVATNYTLTAYHRMVEDTYGNPTITATSRVDVIAFDINRSRAVMKSHGPATNVFSVISSDGELPDWKIEPVNAVSGARISATASGSYGGEAHGTTGIRVNPQQVATNYTITATHPVHTNIAQAAELVVADIVLEPITCETNSIGYTVNPSGVPMDGGFGTWWCNILSVISFQGQLFVHVPWVPWNPQGFTGRHHERPPRGASQNLP